MALKVKEAKEELLKKSHKEIEEETAYKWAARAAAAFELVLESPKEQKVFYWSLAQDFAHEAVEHAAMAEDEALSVLKDVKKELRSYEDKAYKHLETTFGQDLGVE